MAMAIMYATKKERGRRSSSTEDDFANDTSKCDDDCDVTASIVWVVKGQGKVVGDGIRQQVQGAQAHRNLY
eukprot:scaffold145_cov195-Alexandrium_tamarense.AAC.50